jgi:hypothetical protein
MRLNIYDPVRAELLEDIVHRLLDKNIKCDTQLRLDAMSSIQQLRRVIRHLVPPRSAMQNQVREQLLPDEFKMVYWDEYADDEYRKIDQQRQREKDAIEWIGA